MCLVEQKLNARPLTPVNLYVNDLDFITPNHFQLGNENVCLPYLAYAEHFADHRKLSRQTQPYSNCIWTRFRKEYLPSFSNRQKWKCESRINLQPGDLVWLVKDSDKRWYQKLGQVKEIIESSDRTIRAPTIPTKIGVYRRPVEKLIPVILIDKDVFTIENSAGDVEAQLLQHD